MGQWYKLDNAAKLFPAVSNRKNTSVFRLSVILHETINAANLQRAVDHIYSRFPAMFVRMHNGIFWNYMDENQKNFQVKEETAYPCAMIKPQENDGYMLRILYYGKRISLECYHTLTDGGGAVEFMKSLIYYYLFFTGHEFSHENLVLTAGDGASIDEVEDSYQKYCQNRTRTPKQRENAYRIKGTPYPQYGNNVTTGMMSAKALNALAKSYGATITSFLSAVLVHAILESKGNSQRDMRPVIINIPVNLRKLFLSDTLRNFFSVTSLIYQQREEHIFADTAAAMTSQMKAKTTKENLQAVIAQNAALEHNIASRFVPLFLKRLLIGLGADLFSEKKKTMTLSNLGNINIPSGMSKHIDRFEVFSYTSPRNPIICALCSVDDKLSVSFSSIIMEPDIIRRFFTFLSNEGELDVTVYSNHWGDAR